MQTHVLFFFFLALCSWSFFVCQMYFFNFVYVLHFLTRLFLCSPMLIWCLVFCYFCDEPPFCFFFKEVSCLPSGLNGCLMCSEEEGLWLWRFLMTINKKNWRTLNLECIWNAEIHMFCINVSYLFVPEHGWVDGSNGLSMEHTGGVGWWRKLDGLEQLHLIFKTYS